MMCRVNHACVPNVHHQWNAATRRQELRAIRRIKKNEEILTSYFDGAGMTRDERHSLQLKKWNFCCACAKCSLQGEALAASDAREIEIARLDSGIAIIAPFDPEKALRYAKRRIRLLIEDGGADPVEMARTEHDAYQICLKLGDDVEAHQWLFRAYRHNKISRGACAPQTMRLKKLVDAWLA